MALRRLVVSLTDPSGEVKPLIAATPIDSDEFPGGLPEAFAHAMQNSLDAIVSALDAEEPEKPRIEIARA